MLTERAIEAVRVDAPPQARLGDTFAITIAVVDGSGDALPAVVPLQVSILDPQGREAEFSGFYGAKDGRLAIQLDLATNDLPGNWTIRARELASGLQQDQSIEISPLP